MPNRPLTGGVVVPQINFDPMQMVGQIADLQVAKVKIDEARRRSMAQMRQQQLAQQYGGDPDQMIAALSREFPQEGYELGEQYSKFRTAHYTALEKQSDADAKSMETSLNMLIASGGPQNPEHYGMLRDSAVQRNPQLANILVPKEQLTPEAWESMLSATSQGLAFLKQKTDSLRMFQDGNYQEGLGNLLARAPNEQVARMALKGALQDPRAKPFVQMYSAILDAAPDWPTAKQQFAEASIKIAKPGTEGGGSDFAQYLATVEAEKGRPLTSAEKLAERKRYQQIDDRARMAPQPIVIQTREGPQLLNRGTGTTVAIRDAQGNIVEQAPTADMRNRTEARRLLVPGIEKVRSLSENLIARIGPAQRAEALKRGGAAVLGHDPVYRAYQDARFAAAGNLAVMQQGSRPSDADIKLGWLPMIPDVFSDTSESAPIKWDLIYGFMGTEDPRTKTKQGGGGTPSALPAGTKVNDTVTVRGKKVKVTKILPNGQFEGIVLQ